MNKQVVKTSLADISPLINGCLQDGLDVAFTVTGNSMQPLLQHNRDQVVLTSVDPNELKKGDVPLYIRRSGQYVLHRIINAHQGVYTMMGDAQTARENGILPHQIVAVAKGFYRKNHYIDCQSHRYKLWVSFWWHLRGIRPQLLRAQRVLKRLCNLRNRERPE